MERIDKSGLLLCDLQAKAFEMSLKAVPSSSEIFIRRFMNSQVAEIMDDESTAQTIMAPGEIFEKIEAQYGVTNYGSVKYTANEIHWIGYFYRYLAYMYRLASSQVYKMIKPKELRSLYPAYHTMDCAAAIERILETKDVAFDGDIEKQYKLFRKIRKEGEAKKNG